MNFWAAEYNHAFAGKRVVVTGSNGFVGKHLCDALVVLGAKDYGLDIVKRESAFQNQVINLIDRDEVSKAIDKIRPEIIFHLAGFVTARQDIELVVPMLENNLLGTVSLLLAAKEVNCQRIVILGSAEESDDGYSNSPYAASKAAAAHYSRLFYRLYSLPIVLVRLFMAYGPRQSMDKIIPFTINSLLQGLSPEIKSGERVVDFVYISDVIRGLLLSSICPNIDGQEIELGTGVETKVSKAVELLAKMTKSNVQPKFVEIEERLFEKNLVSRSNTANELLGWRPKWTLEKGFSDTIGWYRKELKKQNEASR